MQKQERGGRELLRNALQPACGLLMGPRAQLRQRTGRSSGTCQISTTGGANAWGRPRRARVFASCWYISADEYTQSWWTRPSPATTPKRWRRPPPTTRIPTVLTPNATHQSLPPRMRYWAEAHGLSRGLSTCFRYEDLPAKSSQISLTRPTQQGSNRPLGKPVFLFSRPVWAMGNYGVFAVREAVDLRYCPNQLPKSTVEFRRDCLNRQELAGSRTATLLGINLGIDSG